MIRINNSVEQLRFMRDSGRVRRMHVNDGPDHRIDSHVFGMLMIIISLHPNPSSRLLKAVSLHDMPERITGDIPAPVKWMSKEIDGILNELEEKIFLAVIGYDPIEILDLDEKQWLKGADSFDLWLTSVDYLARGYPFAKNYMTALEREILQNRQDQLPVPILTMWRHLAVRPVLWTHSTKEISDVGE